MSSEPREHVVRHCHIIAERERAREVLVEAQEVQVAPLLQVRLVQPCGRLALQPQLLAEPRALHLLFGLELHAHYAVKP